MLTALAPILAHQGGWDELLMVVAPVAVIAVLLLLANRRAKAALARHQAAEASPAQEHPAG